MRQKGYLIIIGIVTLLLLQGCVSKEEAGEELMQYFNVDIRSEEDDKFSKSLSELVSLMIRAEEEEIAAYMNGEFLPATKDLIDYLEGLEYKSRSVRKLNEMDIDIQQSVYDQFSEFADVLENGNAKEIEAKNEEMEDFNRELERETEKYFDRRRKLIDKYDLTSMTDYNDDGNKVHTLEKKDH